MEQFISPDVLTAFAQVILIDLVLAGDNAIVIGLAAAGLPPEQRNKAILVGVLAATVLRIAFAGVTTQLLQVVGLLFAGGLLLLWVCWKMWRELRTSHDTENDGAEAFSDYDINADGTIAGRAPRKTFAAAACQHVVERHGDVGDHDLPGCRRRARASDGAGVRAGAVDRAHGIGRESDRAASPAAPLDRLSRPRRDPLCRARHDGARRAGAAAHGARRARSACNVSRYRPPICLR